MDEFEKIEKLRARADVSYEEAKAALGEANGDLLDAMIILEKQGKAKAPEQQVHSTEYTTDASYEMIPAGKAKACGGDVGKKLKEFLKKAIDFLSNNFVEITRKGEHVINIPLWLAILAIIFGWWAVLILIVVSLFFDWNYKFYGKDDLKKVNDVVDKAKETAEQVKDSFREE
ncbi:MAG: UBA/TS-N domain protein [Butyrivibrio sp.]|nr:UBA/TS-N domain protein [Butyrivibrio sp.]